MTNKDDDCMQLALAQAEDAFARGDWPVGAVLVHSDGTILASGQNRQNSANDLTVHAETDAIRIAQQAHGLAAIAGSTLYCTMEPCPMCAWALKLAGVHRLVLGLRHADLGRTDLGRYSVESFCELVGYESLVLSTGVRTDHCLAIRERWGKDTVAPPLPLPLPRS